MTLLAPKTLCTWANFCGLSGGKYGAKTQSGWHFRRRNLQAAHGEVGDGEEVDDDEEVNAEAVDIEDEDVTDEAEDLIILLLSPSSSNDELSAQ